MPKATHDYSTSPPGAVAPFTPAQPIGPAATRRSILRAGGLAALTGALGPTAPAHSAGPDTELLRLGRLFDDAAAREEKAWAIADESDTPDDCGPAQRLNLITGAIVDDIEPLAATTLPGALVKMRVILWCRIGDPVELEDISGPWAVDTSTDKRFIVSLLSDLTAMAGLIDAAGEARS